LFGSRTRVPRPILYLTVYGIFLVIVGVTATAQTVMVSVHFSTAALNSTIGSDSATVRTFVNGFLTPSDLEAPMTTARRATVQGHLDGLLERGNLLRVELRAPDGRIIASTDHGATGQQAARTPSFQASLDGGVQAVILRDGEPSEAVGARIAEPSLLREYLPLLDSEKRTQAVVALWRDAGPILARLDAVRGEIVTVTLSAAAIVAVLLFLIFRSAQGRISRQTAQLLESTRRDPLTGLLNHGAMVGELAVGIEAARRADLAIGVALIDIDGFRLLNDTHGHQAGDAALTLLAGQLGRLLPPSALSGRYGPDEFLIMTPAADVAELEPMIERIRTSLVDASLQFDASERIPITISAGIAVFPIHASSVTEILSVVALTLQEAKASGGDAIRIAGNEPEVSSELKAFDTLQGLVIAIDTKDRYTKRHSEDVARYSVFLAHRLGLDEDVLRTIMRAGLLHDIGKIGIPDGILRKPGKLTDAEYATVQQHVSLGDSIIRNIEGVDEVRAGVRHHHERWDGQGYLDRLAGEEIPLIARILAVGDAFSAMTTTRPYRKALSLEEALRRLGDAAGTQLEERLVATFIDGIETAPDAPLPGVETGTPLWVPSARVA
jgi:diguanylate cyclase (GGDEF)-like protein/putative nucleotidyltransferase with HDIG domain